jgi:hypothetical protein
MTKVNKIADDLLEFLNEDTGIAETCKGDLAIKKFNELQSEATNTQKQDQKSYDYTRGLFWDLVNGKALDDNDFMEFVKSAGSKSLQIPTGRMLFNDKLYKTKIKEHNKQMQALIDKYNLIITNNDLDLQTKERSALEIMHGFNALKKVVINKSQKEFQEPEFEQLEISAEEAFELVRNIKDNYELKCKTDIENQRIIAIEQDREYLKDISEDDFKLIKQLQRLIDSNAFFKLFEFNPVFKYGAIHYDTLDEYINRDREFKANTELELSNAEMSAIRFVSEIHKQYRDMRRTNKLKSDMLSMVESLKEK